MASPIQFLLIFLLAYTISTIGINGEEPSDDGSATAKSPALQAKDPGPGHGEVALPKEVTKGSCENDHSCINCQKAEEFVASLKNTTNPHVYDAWKDNKAAVDGAAQYCKSTKCEIKEIDGVNIPVCSLTTRTQGTFYTVGLTLLITLLPGIFGAFGFALTESSASDTIMEKSTFGDAGEKGKELYCDDKDGSIGDGVDGTAPTLA